VALSRDKDAARLLPVVARFAGLVCVCGSFAAAGQARTLMRRERRAR